MITKFGIFEKINDLGIFKQLQGLGYSYPESLGGSFFRDIDEFREQLPYILKFLKEKSIEYHIFHGSDSKGDYFTILFPKLDLNDYDNEETKKFPIDIWNDNSPYLPNNNGEVGEQGFEITRMWKSHIDNCEEIKIEKPEDLDIYLNANKYNI